LFLSRLDVGRFADDAQDALSSLRVAWLKVSSDVDNVLTAFGNGSGGVTGGSQRARNVAGLASGDVLSPNGLFIHVIAASVF
jgi:hypothetical protein